MKKLVSFVAVFAMILTSGISHALSLKGVGKEISKSGVEVGVNNALSKEAGKCTYSSPQAIEPTGCNYKAIIGALTGFHRTAEKSGYANDVNIMITATGKDQKTTKKRAEFLRDQVQKVVNYWDYEVFYKKGGEGIDMKVEVN